MSSDQTPTPTTPAVTARSARETIWEAADSIESLNASPYLTDARMEALRCAKALRALLDAPTNVVERLCEAAAKVHATTYAYFDDGDTKTQAEHVYEVVDAMHDALAAVRASTEAVAPAVGRCTSAILDEKDEEIARVTKERDAAKKDAAEWKSTLDMYAKAWKRELQTWPAKTHEIDALALGTQQLRERYEKALKDIERRDQEIIGLKVERHNAAKAEREADIPRGNYLDICRERDSLKADLEKARGEVERMKADAKKLWRRIPHPFALVPPSEGCDYCGLWRPDHGEAVQERSATPPPASEAISERVRLVYEGAVRLAAADIAEQIGSPRSAFNDYAAHAAGFLAASERAAKGEGAPS